MSNATVHQVVINKDRIRAMLSQAMETHCVTAPASNGKVIDYLPVTDIEAIVMDDRLPYKSPKEFFFPRCEKILSFAQDGAKQTAPEQPVLLFGVKPCDLAAIAVLERVFTMGKFQDPIFMAHRGHTLIIGTACEQKKTACFCDDLAVDMQYSDACDLFLGNSGEDYEVLYVSERGKEQLGIYLPELANFENADHLPKTPPESLSLSEKETVLFEKVNWEALTETCQGCGLCTYICPTCHCFDFKDVEENGTACRYRNWDSCMFPQFTLHASGHNPRDTKAERYRQRVLHKYAYVPKNFGVIACTGCGRCIRSCPTGVSIRQVVEAVRGELK